MSGAAASKHPDGNASSNVSDVGEASGYRTAHEHLADLMLRHDWLLKRELARSRSRDPNDLLGFASISREEVEHQLDRSTTSAGSGVLTDSDSPAPEIDSMLQTLERQIDEKVRRSLVKGLRLPLVELAQRLVLSACETDLLFACIAVELDRRYERVYGFLHDDMSRKLASPALALGLYCDTLLEQLEARELLSPPSVLRYYRLIEVIEEGGALPWASRAMRVDPRILAFVLGESASDARLTRHVTVLDAAGTESSASLDWVARVADELGAVPQRKKPFVYLHGERHAGADALVSRAASELGLQVLVLDAESLLEPGVDFELLLFALFREGLLSQSAVFLRQLDRVLDTPAGATRYRVILRCFAEMGLAVFASGERHWSWQSPAKPASLHLVELQPGGFVEQLQAWQAQTHDRFDDTELHRLISLHPTPVAAIADTWRMAEVLAEAEGSGEPTLAHVHSACRRQHGVPASSLARRIEPKHNWDDLVLPRVQSEQLAAICSHAKHSSIVYGAWGFDRKLSLGRGLNVLFSGPPGTGKTMAAEVIAAELGVEMLKIDLSQITSKYIGETEKNLRQLFDQAATANAILFFDEADALLGKRSEVKDAHDRYANTETAYLLQKMEEYPGITVLATNLRQNLDEAFTRRMRFIIEFSLPEIPDRLRIWRSVWPAQMPLATDVDFALLAQRFRLSGGSIRNAALSAAFLAAEQQQSVCMSHLMHAIKREFQKMGRLVNEDEYRSPQVSRS